jgi:hypothetical protein
MFHHEAPVYILGWQVGQVRQIIFERNPRRQILGHKFSCTLPTGGIKECDFIQVIVIIPLVYIHT